MKPLSTAEVNAINRLVRKGLCSKQIAAQVGRSTTAINRVRRGVIAGKNPKVSRMDRIDIYAWYQARKALGTMADMARKYKVTDQYIRDICREIENEERSEAQHIGRQHEVRA